MEKWEDFFQKEELNLIQKIHLANLKVIIDVCNRLDIDYFLYGGSLLGAVRHKGFIPWDDDLDIGMPRESYEIFVKKAPKILPENYYLQTPYSDKKTPYYYSKLRLCETTMVESFYEKLKINHGIYVDIYPIDNLPNDEKEYFKQYKKFKKFNKLFVYRQCPYSYSIPNSFKGFFKNLGRRIVSLFLRIIPSRWYVKKIDSISTKYNNVQSKRYGNYSYPKPTNIFQSIYPLKKGSFCGLDVNLPSDWHYHLSQRYGDYMKLPPLNERIGHKPGKLDFGPYKNMFYENSIS